MRLPSLDTSTKVLTWTAPAVGIPALRFFQDRRDQRKELFVRDLSTYSIGAGLFLAINALLFKFSKSRHLPLPASISEKQREFGAFLTALAANIGFAGLAAPHISQQFNDHQKQTCQSAFPLKADRVEFRAHPPGRGNLQFQRSYYGFFA